VSDDRVCVVAVRDETFARCERGVYPVPAGYDRASRPFDYLGVYRTAPASAITHYAPVTDRVAQARGEPGPLSAADWRATIDPFSDADRVVVFELGDLVALADPVDNDQHGVRGARYCSLADLRRASVLSELAGGDP
jgi:hypothetical protein